MKIDAILTDLADALAVANDHKYVRDELPCETDELLCLAISRLASLDKDDIWKIVEGLTRSDASILELFSERMATLAVRETRADRLRIGLFALALCVPLDDIREVILIVSLHYRSAEIIGCPPDELFSEVSDKLGDIAGVTSYPKRTPHNRSIAVMGYEEIDDGNGFRYKRNW